MLDIPLSSFVVVRKDDIISSRGYDFNKEVYI